MQARRTSCKQEDANMLTATALTALKNDIIAMASTAKFTIGGTDYSGTIANSGIDANGIVEFGITLSLSGITSGTLTKVTIYNSSSNAIWEKTENMAVDQAALTLEYHVKISTYYLADTVWASFYIDGNGNLHYNRTENEDLEFYIDDGGNLHVVNN